MIPLLRIRTKFLENEDSYLWKLFDEMQMIIGGNVFEGRMWISSHEIILSPYRHDKPLKKILVRDIKSYQESGNYVIIFAVRACSINTSTNEEKMEQNVEFGVLNIKPFMIVLKILQKLQNDNAELVTQIQEYENSFPCPMKIYGEPVVDKAKSVFVQNDLRFKVQIFFTPYSLLIRPFVHGKVIRVPYARLESVMKTSKYVDIPITTTTTDHKASKKGGNSLIITSHVQKFNFQLVFGQKSRCELIYEDYIPSSKKSDQLEEMTKKWKSREISNRNYVVFLNRLFGRSFHQSSIQLLFPTILEDISNPRYVGHQIFKQVTSHGMQSLVPPPERPSSSSKEEEEEENEGEDDDREKKKEDGDDDKDESAGFPYALQRMIFCPDQVLTCPDQTFPGLPLWCNGSLPKFLEITRSILEGRVISDSLHKWVKKTFKYDCPPRNSPLFISPQEQKLEDEVASLKNQALSLSQDALSQRMALARMEEKHRATKQQFRRELLEKTEEIQDLNSVNLEILEMVKRTSFAQERVRKFVTSRQKKLQRLRSRYNTRTNYVDYLENKVKQLKERERCLSNSIRNETCSRLQHEGRAREWEDRCSVFQSRLRDLRAKQRETITRKSEQIMKKVSKKEEELSKIKIQYQNKEKENQGLRQELRRALLNLSKLEKKIKTTEGLRERLMFGTNPFEFREKKSLEKVMMILGDNNERKKSDFKYNQKQGMSPTSVSRKLIMKKKWRKIHEKSFSPRIKKKRN